VLSCVPTVPTAAVASTLTLLEAAREEWAEPGSGATKKKTSEIAARLVRIRFALPQPSAGPARANVTSNHNLMGSRRLRHPRQRILEFVPIIEIVRAERVFSRWEIREDESEGRA
jgi:hypothetical protein